MKSFIKYLNETMEDGKHGWWENFEDEDTGEVIPIWRVEDTPEVKKLVKKYKEQEEKEYKAIKDRWEEWRQKNLDICDEEIAAENEVEELQEKQRIMYSDMEDEVSHAKEEDQDTVANKWGGDLGDVDEELSRAIERLAAARKASQVHFDEQDKILAAEDKYWETYEKHRDEIQKLREKITW